MSEPAISEPAKLPSMSFNTFWTYISDLASKPLPPSIDRSMMSNKSGTVQADLFGALRVFGLINDDHVVLPTLVTLVEADEQARKQILGNIIRSHYEPPLRVSAQNGTENQLQEVFKNEYGLDSRDTRDKTIRFFLHAAQEAGLPLSPHFKKTRQVGPRSAPRTPRATRKPTSTPAPATPTTRAAAGDSYSVTLKSGGIVSVTVDVDLFKLSTSDREFVIGLVDKLTGYEQPVEAGADESP